MRNLLTAAVACLVLTAAAAATGLLTEVAITNVQNGGTVNASGFVVGGTASETNYVKVELYDSDGVLVTWNYSYVGPQGGWSTTLAGDPGTGYRIEAWAFSGGEALDSDTKTNITLAP